MLTGFCLKCKHLKEGNGLENLLMAGNKILTWNLKEQCGIHLAHHKDKG